MPKRKSIASSAKKGAKPKLDLLRKKAKGLMIHEGRRMSTPVVSHPPGKSKDIMGEPETNIDDIQFSSTESDSGESGGSRTPIHTPAPTAASRQATQAHRASEGRSQALPDPMLSTSQIVPVPQAPIKPPRHANRLKVAGLRTILEEKILSVEGVRE